MEKLCNLYWDNRYKSNDFGWDIGRVSDPLKEYIDQLHNRSLKILIPGAGNAYEAEYLFKLGFKNIYVLDFASTPLLNIKNRLPNFPDNQLILQDFFDHYGQYDLILEQTFFCALNPTLRSKYVQHMREILAPNGKIVGLLFNDSLNFDKPPFGGYKEQYEKLFKDSFDIKKMEPCYNSIKPRDGRELFVILKLIS